MNHILIHNIIQSKSMLNVEIRLPLSDSTLKKCGKFVFSFKIEKKRILNIFKTKKVKAQC